MTRSMGARPMGRVIQQDIKKELANELLFGQLSDGGNVKIDLKKDELSFTYESLKKSKATEAG